ELFHTTEPFFWNELFKNRQLDPQQQLFFDEARAFGAHEGLVTPFHDFNGVTAVMVAGRYPDAQDPLVRIAGPVLSSYYASIGRRIVRGQEALAATAPHLTERQTECLNWVRAGKTSYEIGVILGISSRVVDEHIAGACERLQVRTRTQAVIEAAAHGLL